MGRTAGARRVAQAWHCSPPPPLPTSALSFPGPCRMCGSLSLRPAKSAAGTLRSITALIHSFILLHEALAVLPPLAQALQGAQCALLQAVGAACGHAAFAQLQGELEAVLEEDVQSAKNAFLNRQAGWCLAG